MKLFRKQEDQDEKLIKNMEEYAKKEKEIVNGHRYNIT